MCVRGILGPSNSGQMLGQNERRLPPRRRANQSSVGDKQRHKQGSPHKTVLERRSGLHIHTMERAEQLLGKQQRFHQVVGWRSRRRRLPARKVSTAVYKVSRPVKCPQKGVRQRQS